MRFQRPVNQRLAKKPSKKNSPLSSAFRRTWTSAVGSVMAAHVARDGRQNVQFVDNLFIAILQCMLSTNVNVYGTLASGSKYLFVKLLLISSSNIVYLSAFFASLRQVTAKRCAKPLTDFVS